MTFRKLGADVVVRGEFAEVVAMLTGAADLAAIPAIVFAEDDAARIVSGPHAPRFTDPPALQRPDEWGSKHHHRFDRKPERPGAEVEASHGCSHPYPNSNWSAARLTDV